jgi:N-acetylmuramic acid 6-phosphate (MurNAc-6-P) etherase
MVRLGLVRSNLMTGMRGDSCKLRERAVRIVMELSTRSRPEAIAALDTTNGNVDRALALLELLPPTDK